TLKRATVTGDTVTTICQADTPTGISWGPDGIVFGQGGKGILRVSANGGTPAVLVRVKDGETAQAPQVLPGGQHALFTLATGTANFAFSGTGSLVYVRGPVSASALLDIGLMERKGKVEPLRLPPGSYEWPRVSPDGKRLAVASDDDKEATIWIYDLSGTRAM